MYFLGLDTSNYTTSVALYDQAHNEIIQQKKLLPVKDGALGLRQSDAVFSHVKQLGDLVEELMRSYTGSLDGIGVSTRPRDVEGSYMPCFLVGELVARAMAAVNHIPLRLFSHQEGHIMAALYSTGKMDLIGKSFIAFHLSGGTTECLLITPSQEKPFHVELLAQSLDLKAGQAVDRVGGLLGLSFPAGRQLDELARKSQKVYKVKPAMKGADCSLSGIENRCKRMLEQGEQPCDVARYCIDSVYGALEAMTLWARKSYGFLPVIYSGGVMSNSIIRERITSQYQECYFADPAFSSDNGAGIAILAGLSHKGSEMP